MMKALRTNLAVKLVAFFLAIATGAGGFWASLFILSQWDTLWTGTGYYTSNSYYQDLSNRFDQARELTWLIQYKEWNDGSLPYLDQQRLEELQELLSPEKTNFRFAIRRNDTGVLLYTNADPNQALDSQVHTVVREAVTTTMDRDALSFSGDQDSEPTEYADNGDRVLSSELVLEFGVTDPLTVEDEFYLGRQEYGEYARYLPALALLALALDILFVVLLVFLLRAAGWRKGEERPVRGGFDRIPLDLLTFGLICAVALLLAGGDSMTFAANQSGLTTDLVVGLALLSCGTALCVLYYLLTLAVRFKTHTVLSCTVIAALCRLIARAVRAMARSWPLT